MKKKQEIKEVTDVLENLRLNPEDVNTYLETKSSSPVFHKTKVSQLLLRPDISLKEMAYQIPSINKITSRFSNESLEQVEIQFKYEVYLQKEKDLVDRMATLENQVIPENFNYEKLSSLSNEARQKFNKIKPQTLGQASRISGVNPSDVQILMVYMGR